LGPIICAFGAKRTEKDLHKRLFHIIFAPEMKKSAHDVAAFRKYAYLCAVVCEQHSATSRRAVKL
jgi:predicted SprT family Zn-dependent metalloprotease